MTDPEPTGYNWRMQSGGKLSFRRSAQEVADDQDLPVVIGGENPPRLEELVPAHFARVEVEIGSGKGAFLAAAAALAPDTFYLGIEASPSFARLAAQRVHQAGLVNALLLTDNGRLYLEDSVPAGGLDRVHVYYPDPWPKRRHRKRRFFIDTTAAIVHAALKPSGHLLVATDNAAYAGQIARMLGGSPLFARDEAEERRLLAGPPGSGFSPTSFEQKYLAEGRILRRYAFRRVEAQ